MTLSRRNVLIVLVAALLGLPGPAVAQESGDVHLELVRQPPWHETDDDLDVVVSVTNDGSETLEGFGLGITVYQRVLSRSGLHESYDGTTGLSASLPRNFFQRSIPPGGSTRVALRNPVTDFPTLTEGGVYPLTISLYESAGVQLDTFTSELIYYPSPPETPLTLALLLPLNEVPARGPEGVFEAEDGGVTGLEQAVSEGGWLTGVLDVLEARAESLRLAVAPTPRLFEELADLADGYARVVGGERQELGPRSPEAEDAAAALDRLRGLLNRPGVQNVFVPYAFPDLPTLTERFPAEYRFEQRHVSEADAVLSATIGEAPTPRWFYPPAGRLDLGTLDDLRELEPEVARYTFFSADALVPAADPAAAGCPESFATFTCPVRVQTLAGPSTGLVTDADIQERMADLTRPGDDALDLQRVLAETAMIREELPSVGGRILHVSVPSLWRPDPGLAEALLGGIAEAPWLQTRTPRAALAEGLDLVEAFDAHSLITRHVVDELAPPGELPDGSYFVNIVAAEEAVESLRQLRPPLELVRRLDRNILVAQSRSWWSDPELVARGAENATAAEQTATDQLANVSIGGSDVVTLTSREGEVQLQVVNDNDYPVTLSLVLSSAKLRFEQPGPAVFEPGTTQLNIAVTAESSGILALDVRLETSEGLVVGEGREIEIRSTEFNEIALAITLGALAFLILFYALRGARRRRGPRPSENASEASPA